MVATTIKPTTTKPDINTDTIEHLDFDLAVTCELFIISAGKERPCGNEAFALLKSKCDKCSAEKNRYICLPCFTVVHRDGLLHGFGTAGCKGTCFYITHVPIK